MRHLTISHDIVLVGGGHAHALVLREFGRRPVAGARLTLIDPDPKAPYTGMLPGHVAGHYGRDELEIDLVGLARFAGARLIPARAEGIDLAAGAVTVAGRPPVGFDQLSLDIGITSDMPALPGFTEHGVAAKPLGRFADRWRRVVEGAEPGMRLPVVVIGGGVAGVELSMAMSHRLKRAGAEPVVTVVEAGTALRGISDAARKALLRALRDQGITLAEHAEVAEVRADSVRLSDGRDIPAALTVGAAGARPHDWLAGAGLDLTDGCVTVDRHLRSVTDPRVFAAGDCAHLSHAPRPKAGVYAVRAAPALDANLRAVAAGGPLVPFDPQGDYLKLVSLGGKSALADKFGRAFEGRLMWRLKDWIDRAFMDQFHDPPRMDQPGPPPETAVETRRIALGAPPLCGGCGAKVAADVLGGALGDLSGRRGDVESVIGDDAAILKVGGARQVLSVDHLREFTRDPFLMGRVTAVHAMGDIWAMGASPQAALPSITLETMTPRLQRRTLAELIAGIRSVTDPAGAAIVGGHTSQGAEMSVGLSLTGLVDRPVTNAGARPGDALVLTKPLGSGVILAAEMSGRADGRVVASAFGEMQTDQAAASRVLAPVARSMTDVTGFGLAGHLLSMMRASGAAAELAAESIPAMDGAAELYAEGVRPSLWPQNREAAFGGDLDLLYDPQTAGGLLAAVPASEAEGVLSALVSAGVPATRIGKVTEGIPAVTLV